MHVYKFINLCTCVCRSYTSGRGQNETGRRKEEKKRETEGGGGEEKGGERERERETGKWR